MAQWLSYPLVSGPFSGQEQLLAASSTSPGAGMIRIPWSAVSGLITGTGFLPLTGGTLTGPLTLPGNATLPLQAVPLQQVQAITGGPFLQIAGGTLTGPLTLAADPTLPLGAATKEYMDGAVAGGPFLPLSGGTVSGPIVLPGNATLPLQAVPLQQVTSIIGGPYLPLGGGTLTGALVLAADPTLSLGAATKQYVDSAVLGGPFLPLAGGTVTGATTFSADVTFSGASTGLAVSNNATVGGTFVATGGINGTPVGAVTPSTGAFTNLSASGTVTLPTTTTGPFLLLTGGTVSGPTTFSASGTALTATGPVTFTSSLTGSTSVGELPGALFASVPSANINGAPTTIIDAASVSMVAGGSVAAAGQWNGLDINFNDASVPTNDKAAGTPGAFVGLQIARRASQNQGGTGLTPPTSFGQSWGMDIVAVALAGATNLALLNGLEINMGIHTGASVVRRSALQISNPPTHVNRGAVWDMEILFARAAGAATALQGLAFGGGTSGTSPLGTDSVLLTHQLAQDFTATADTGIDFSEVTYTTAAMQLPGAFTVSPAGALQLSTAFLAPTTAGLSIDVAGSIANSTTTVSAGGTGYAGNEILLDTFGGVYRVNGVSSGVVVSVLTYVEPTYPTLSPPATVTVTSRPPGQGTGAVLIPTWQTNRTTLALQPSNAGPTTFGGGSNNVLTLRPGTTSASAIMLSQSGTGGFQVNGNLVAAASHIFAQTTLASGTAGGTSCGLTIQALAGNTRPIIFNSGSSLRWIMNVNTAAESGANAGSDLDLVCYDDSGTAILNPMLRITRATGNAKFFASIGVNGTTPPAKPTITGVKLPSDTVMANLLAALVSYGFITDSTT